ncbi:heterogeneous nuclear ribonucleoprotein R isoform X3 [Patella vulgata]|uniref:heterogeneous nuclear ribonucleoprotein R isoform X3 n=1 Tax=Patella vulgata TaxID=6465 RepID=UPI0024A9E2D2|nr:heterogeneous nuclear ribonucleoprotein R isoform X3 [Patella vulgata]
MAENGEEQMDQQTEDQLLGIKQEEMETELNGYADDLQKLLDYGISKKVSMQLIKIYISGTGKLTPSDLDERALDALKEFNADDAVEVLKQFNESNLEHVGNKSAFLCGQMKTFRQKSKQGAQPALAKGPDEAKLKEILDRTGYSLDITTGQRKYGGPPPDCDGVQPGPGHEVFVGKIPKDIFEDELVPLFEKTGKIWDLRLMMDPLLGQNRGYCFVTYCDKEGAKNAVKQLDDYEIRKGKTLKVNVSIANLRLFVGNIPKNKTREEIKEEFTRRTDGLQDVIVYGSADNPKLKNRGFAFLEYDSHKAASTAKRKIGSGRVKVWGCDIIVDWADPQEEPDDETMDKVKVLYLRNLTSEVTEEALKEKFEAFGKVERVKKIKDYAFVHFEERDFAVKAMEELKGTKIGNLEVEISLAKPQNDNKKKEIRKRDFDRRYPGRGYGGYDDYWGPPTRMPPGRGGMRGGRMPMPPRAYADPYYDDFYGYDDFDYYGGYAPVPPRGRGGRGDSLCEVEGPQPAAQAEEALPLEALLGEAAEVLGVVYPEQGVAVACRNKLQQHNSVAERGRPEPIST